MARVLGADGLTGVVTLLVVFGGLPGTGKTSLARGVAGVLGATMLRVDSIEVAIGAAGLELGSSPAGYTVAQAVAADQLRAGRPVVVDAVNPVRVARAGWERTAAACDAELRFVRVVLADRDEHRRRVETREADLPGHVVPSWAKVAAEVHDPWHEPHLELDNGSSLAQGVETVLAWLRPRDATQRVAAGVRLLGTADAGELFTLQLAAWVSEARANATLDIPPLQEGPADVRDQVADPALTIWGLREHGRLIATVRTSLLDDRTAFVGRLGVVPDLARHGLGSAMLGHAEARLPAQVTRIELVTGLHSTGNHAFYARHGYEPMHRDEVAGIVRMAKVRA